MNEKEKLEAYIANCKCCLLAQAMKECPLCRFNIGLATQVTLTSVTPLPAQEHIVIFTLAE
jgi:hypothetical protein